MFLCRSWFIGITQTPTVLDDCRGLTCVEGEVGNQLCSRVLIINQLWNHRFQTCRLNERLGTMHSIINWLTDICDWFGSQPPRSSWNWFTRVCGKKCCNRLIAIRFKNLCPQTCRKKIGAADYKSAIVSQSVNYKTIICRPQWKARITRPWHRTNTESKHLERSEGAIRRPAGPGICRRRRQIRKGFKAAGGSGELTFI